MITETEIGEVVEVLRGGNLARGTKTALFEARMATLHGKPFGMATSSGTSALHVALAALGADQGYEVIIPSYVCSSVLDAVNYTGASPIIGDIGRSYSLDASTIEPHISSSTKAIVVPHMFGIPANIEGIIELGVPVIEDCAQAVGASQKGRLVGSFGSASIYSFGPTKVMTAGYGGMALFSQPDDANAANQLLNNGNRDFYRVAQTYPFSDVQAALGLSQLEHLDSFIERRRQIAAYYDGCLTSSGIVQEHAAGAIFYRYTIETNDASAACALLKERGIDAEQPVYAPLHGYLHLSPSDFPRTEHAMKSLISIPLYPALSDRDVNYIGDALVVLGEKIR